MADVTITEATAATGETEMVTAKAGKSARRKMNSADATEVALKAKTAKQPAAKSRKYSDEERLEKVRLIDAQISDGKRTLKEAVKDAGISDQTYYIWKRNVTPHTQLEEGPIAAGDEFRDLLKLEAENLRLRKLLAEKLRAENADLRRRLGLD